MPNSSLFARDAVYVSDAVDRDAVFSDVYQHLLKAGYVKWEDWLNWKRKNFL